MDQKDPVTASVGPPATITHDDVFVAQDGYQTINALFSCVLNDLPSILDGRVETFLHSDS
jgi:hypothetical protein